ncbi:hypothetical protein AZI87_15385 [Bdellovibrio bacteriovorus]|uniref:Uncharacterized protein n=1 Tax=Bdellovibrio bacteriovorus TaxID=959 RepID=A0A162FX36_BDEBC|nr:hypothetical protein AZI87_15385 [Bdellovibrio bacteriovorus]
MKYAFQKQRLCQEKELLLAGKQPRNRDILEGLTRRKWRTGSGFFGKLKPHRAGDSKLRAAETASNAIHSF